jgi:hypothetical protein
MIRVGNLFDLVDRDTEREKKSTVPMSQALAHSERLHPNGRAVLADHGDATPHRVADSSTRTPDVQSADYFPSPLFDAPDECFRCGMPPTGTWHCPTGRYELACDEHRDPPESCCGGRCRHCDAWRRAQDGGQAA